MTANSNLKESSIRRFAISSAVSFSVCAAIVAAAYFIDGKTIATRCATDLVMPIGLIWIALLVLVIYGSLGRQWGIAVSIFGLFLVLSITGNTYISSKFIQSIEMPERAPGATRENPYRTVIVLGGGTETTSEQTAELHRDGERVFSAAQLWHAGLVASITCSGADPYGATPPRDLAATLLKSVGVPPDKIFRFAGENTSQEMRKLKLFLEDPPEGFPEAGSVALITSAFHMPRAMRLAAGQGLQLDPQPCGYRSDYFPRFSPRLLIPNADAANVFGSALKETLAGLVGR